MSHRQIGIDHLSSKRCVEFVLELCRVVCAHRFLDLSAPRLESVNDSSCHAEHVSARLPRAQTATTRTHTGRHTQTNRHTDTLTRSTHVSHLRQALRAGSANRSRHVDFSAAVRGTTSGCNDEIDVGWLVDFPRPRHPPEGLDCMRCRSQEIERCDSASLASAGIVRKNLGQ